MAWLAESGWLPLFAEYLIKSTLALALALILVLLSGKRSASFRHFVLSLALAGLLLLPVLRQLGRGWETSLLPATSSGASITLSAREDGIPGGKRSGGIEQEDHGLLQAGSSSPPMTLAPGERPQDRSTLLFKTVIPLVWSAGLLLLLLRLTAGLFGAFRLTREGETVHDPCWQVLLERFLAAIHLQRRVRLKSHHDIRVPLTCGFIRPVVLIPDGHEAWTEEQRSSTLIHELSHIKRADFLVMMLVRLSLALFWFNPLSWVVFRRLKNEQEEACDELALRTGIKPSTYAANLLFFKSAAGCRLSHFAALLGLFGFGRSAFNARLAAILRQKWTFQEVKMKTKVLLFCAVILAVALIGLARPSTSVTEEAEPAVGSLSSAGENVLANTSYRESAVVQTAEQTQEQSQAEEKKGKEKEPKKQAVVVTIKEGEKHGHKIIVSEGDKVKTIVVDRPVIIKARKEGKIFIVTPDGNMVKVLEGETPHLEIEADKLEFIEEGKIVKIGKDGSIIYLVAEPAVDVSDAVATVEPSEAVEINEIAEPHMTWVIRDKESLIREKLRDIREKLKEVEEKKLEIQKVDEALADLEKDLERMSREISGVAIKHREKPEVFTVIRKKGDEETAAEIEPGIAIRSHEHPIKVVAKDKGSFLICYEASVGENGREAYDRIVARVKKELPEGFSLEPEFEEESGLITLKISGPFGKGAPSELVQKLADCIREETGQKKE